MLGMVEQIRQDAPVEVWNLGDTPEREHARAGIERRGEPARLDRHAGVALDREKLPQAQVGAGERGRAVAALRLDPVDDVASQGVVKNHRARLEGLSRVGDGRERLPVDVDQIERVFREIAALGEHERDGLADVANSIARERRLKTRGEARPRRQAHRNVPDRLEIASGDDGRHSRQRAGALGVDRAESRVRVRRSQHRAVQHSREAHVAGVLPAAGEQSRILLAEDRRSDRRPTHGDWRALI